MKPTAPGLLSHIFALRSTFSLRLFSDILNQKYKNTLQQFILIYFIWRSIYQYYNSLTSVLPIVRRRTRKELTTPFTRRVASICYLCASVVYVVLLGSPIGSMTLVS